jgi:hypothetical protein
MAIGSQPKPKRDKNVFLRYQEGKEKKEKYLVDKISAIFHISRARIYQIINRELNK